MFLTFNPNSTQELGFLKGVGATFDSKELVLDAWKSREVARGEHLRVMTAAVAFPYPPRI